MNDGWSMAREVVEWMQDHIPGKSRVLELGGGRGSKRIQRAWKDSLTIESDPTWVGFLLKQGCAVLHRPLVDGWYEMDNVLREELEAADVVVVDGPIGYLRTNIHPHLGCIKAGAIVVFDDTHRAKVRRLVRWPVLAVIQSNRRTTHICKVPSDADNPYKEQTKPVAGKSKRKRTRKDQRSVRQPEVEKVSPVVPEPESVVQPMPKAGESS